MALLQATRDQGASDTGKRAQELRRPSLELERESEQPAAHTSRRGGPGRKSKTPWERRGSRAVGRPERELQDTWLQPPTRRLERAVPVSGPGPQPRGVREQGRPRASDFRGAAAGAMLKPKDLCPRAGTRTFLEAMQAGKVHLARFVLDALDRSIIDCRAEQGRTPLMVAVGLPDPAMRSRFVRLLLEQGAAVNLRDERGRTALSLACERGHLDAVQQIGRAHV